MTTFQAVPAARYQARSNVAKHLAILLLFLFGAVCLLLGQTPVPGRIDAIAYHALMQKLADAWSRQDLEAALSCFADDAAYMEPPDIQLYRGKAQLRPYFAALKPGTYMKFHNLWFDVDRQIGSGEYSFGHKDKATAEHGVVVTELKAGRIQFWREYQREGPAEFGSFLSQEGSNGSGRSKTIPKITLRSRSTGHR